MPKNGHVYEQPSRLSKALIVCFSAAAVLMAGWLVLMMMFSRGGSSVAANTENTDVPAMVTKSAPRIENTAGGYALPPSETSIPLATSGPTPWRTGAARSPDAPPGDSGSYATSALGARNDTYQGDPNDFANADPDAGTPARGVPLPVPRPRVKRAAAPTPKPIVPRPKANNEEQAQAAPPEKSFLDYLFQR